MRRPVCVCGRQPCIVKCRSRYLAACPAAMECAMRGEWKTTEQAAIKSWNAEIEAVRHKRRK